MAKETLWDTLDRVTREQIEKVAAAESQKQLEYWESRKWRLGPEHWAEIPNIFNAKKRDRFITNDDRNLAREAYIKHVQKTAVAEGHLIEIAPE